MVLRNRTRRSSQPGGGEWSGLLYLYPRLARPELAWLLTQGLPAAHLDFPWSPLANVMVAWGYLEPDTARAEAERRGWHAPLAGAPPPEPCVFSARLECVWDLRGGTEQRYFGLTGEDFRDGRPAGPAGRAAQAVWDRGAEGLLVPSAVVEGGSLLVLFPEFLRPGSHFRPTSARWIGGD